MTPTTGRRSVLDLIAEAANRFTPSERRVAEAVMADPKVVAFGTVAQLAETSGSSGPTVLRFAAKLGFDGFVELQASVQEEIADQLRPATQRIRERPLSDVIGRTLTADLENVRTTLGEVEPDDFRTAVELLSDRRRRIFVIASEVSGGAGRLLAGQLDLLRDGVHEITGTPVRVSRDLVRIEQDDVVVVVDLRRYERWLLETTSRAADTGARLIAITDGRLSPLADRAEITFVIAARGVGPFDSAVGAMSLVHALVAAVAARLRRSATGRLDAVEDAWRAGTDLVEQ
ncbi:MAG TPA: MurR/RpiR family transcriptional regulator [Acidimicrobiia bacterium]|jgi:DNA-binding MurR/RpiR family transcriptional regulator|nr:MurR/RpiR family transcriptional regulator [Acidimicrobiia bacterium]